MVGSNAPVLHVVFPRIRAYHIIRVLPTIHQEPIEDDYSNKLGFTVPRSIFVESARISSVCL